MSCTFIDHLRRPIDGMNAASIVAVDIAKDGSPNDLVVFGTASAGPNPGSDGKNSEILKAIACTENPAGCQPLTTLGPSLALAHQSELNYGPASPLPSPFNAPFQMVDGATAVDSNGDGTLEIAIFAGRTPFGDSFMHLFEPKEGS